MLAQREDAAILHERHGRYPRLPTSKTPPQPKSSTDPA